MDLKQFEDRVSLFGKLRYVSILSIIIALFLSFLVFKYCPLFQHDAEGRIVGQNIYSVITVCTLLLVSGLFALFSFANYSRYRFISSLLSHLPFSLQKKIDSVDVRLGWPSPQNVSLVFNDEALSHIDLKYRSPDEGRGSFMMKLHSKATLADDEVIIAVKDGTLIESKCPKLHQYITSRLHQKSAMIKKRKWWKATADYDFGMKVVKGDIEVHGLEGNSWPRCFEVVFEILVDSFLYLRQQPSHRTDTELTRTALTVREPRKISKVAMYVSIATMACGFVLMICKGTRSPSMKDIGPWMIITGTLLLIMAKHFQYNESYERYY